MTIVRTKLFAAALAFTVGLAATACGSDTKSTVDATGNGIDAKAGDAPGGSVLPTWKLKDVQPLSPRTGQTYGLDTFNDKIVVVTLLQGF
jgi:hypothetical protein